MKTILRAGNNASLYLFGETESLATTETTTTVGDPEFLIIADCGTENSSIVGGVLPPDDWAAWKYFYVDGQWIPNQDWVDPQATG
jgi:hypothetical protein